MGPFPSMHSTRTIQRQRLINALAYFASKVKYPFKVKIFKLLFFFDFTHFKETGLPATDSSYYAWARGPVPKDLFEELEKGHIPNDLNQLLSIITQQKEDGITSYRFAMRPKRKADLSVFSPRQIRIMDELIEIYREATGAQMSEVTHLPKSPWDRTRKDKGDYAEIDYMLAIDDSALVSEEDAKDILEEHREFMRNLTS
jgi:uncharacterized phage-associated protein